MKGPFTIRKEGGICFLELDSQGSTVNVFTRAAAQQINEFFEQFNTQPSFRGDTQMIVVRSTKPYSFLNGAELILTHAVKTMDDLQHFTSQTRAAYEKIEKCPVPTVAAIDGNCFGCGMEFSLYFDYRIVSDSFDTCFYLTEIKDYYLLPLFGSIERLPPLIGLKDAIDLLVWGEKWHSKAAFEHGLVDYVLDSRQFSTDLFRILGELSTRGKPARKRSKLHPLDLDQLRVNTLRRISDLPPDHQPLYRRGLELLLEVVENRKPLNQEATSRNTFETLATEASRKSAEFFFIRTMATVASLGGSSRIPENKVEIAISNGKKDKFQNIMMERRLRDLEVYISNNRKNKLDSKASFYLKKSTNPSDSSDHSLHPVEVVWGYQEIKESYESSLIYFPGEENIDLCEVFINSDHLSDFKSFLTLFPHLGWQPIVIRSSHESVVNILIKTYLDTIHQMTQNGVKSQDLNHSLWLFGSEVLPLHIIDKFDTSKTMSWSQEFRAGKNQPQFLDELFLPLYEIGKKQVSFGKIKHTSQIDLIMNAVLGFPLSRGGFCQYVAQGVVLKKTA